MTSLETPIHSPAQAGTKYLDHARAMVPVLRGEAAFIEQQRELTPRVLDELRSRNLLQVLLAPARGEGDVTTVDTLRILETLATGDGSTAWDVMASMGAVFVGSFLPQETVERIFATPADTAATAVGRIGKATSKDGGYVVEASWPFLSGSPHAGWIGGLCIVFDGDQERSGPDGQPHIVMPFLRKAQTRLKDDWQSMGLCGTGSQTADVDGVFVPSADVVDFARGPRPDLPLFYSIPEDSIAPLAAASVAAGIARRAIDAFRAQAPRRMHQSGVFASEAPLPQLALARSEALVDQASAHLMALAQCIDDGLTIGELPDTALVQRVSLAAAAAVESVVQVTSTLFRAAGSSAVFNDSVLGRALRDVYTLGAHRMVQGENYLVHGPHLFA
jgi:alkylation response protein AidB-like acyl-CoA dehydrogenase